MSEMTNEQFETFLKTVLKRQAPPADETAVDRVLKRLSGPLPRQKQPFWRLPGVLLDWQFAPAWPRMAALACCAVLGFFVGIAGIDRQFDNPATPPAYIGGGGIGAITFEPDAFTGARP
jgi:hypothetical protein